MKLFFVISLGLMLFSAPCAAQAQTTEPRKFEVSFIVPMVLQRDSGQTAARIGIGQRLTFNLNQTFALEAESNQLRKCSFSDDCRIETKGPVTQALFGLRVGRKVKDVLVFGKFRPGFVRYGTASVVPFTTPVPGSIITPMSVSTLGRTDPALDVGGGVAFNLSRRLFMRFDVGDTIVRHGVREVSTRLSNNQIITQRLPARTTHNLQVTASFGLRF